MSAPTLNTTEPRAVRWTDPRGNTGTAYVHDGDTVQVSRDFLAQAHVVELGALFSWLATEHGVRWLEVVE